jgi:hypothetical protein
MVGQPVVQHQQNAGRQAVHDRTLRSVFFRATASIRIAMVCSSGFASSSVVATHLIKMLPPLFFVRKFEEFSRISCYSFTKAELSGSIFSKTT